MPRGSRHPEGLRAPATMSTITTASRKTHTTDAADVITGSSRVRHRVPSGMHTPSEDGLEVKRLKGFVALDILSSVPRPLSLHLRVSCPPASQRPRTALQTRPCSLMDTSNGHPCPPTLILS